jgi:hypothetical protein
MELRAHPLAMDLINIAIARDASRRALLGARLDDPVVPDSPSRLNRARRALARTRGRRPPARSAPVVTQARQAHPKAPALDE